MDGWSGGWPRWCLGLSGWWRNLILKSRAPRGDGIVGFGLGVGSFVAERGGALLGRGSIYFGGGG